MRNSFTCHLSHVLVPPPKLKWDKHVARPFPLLLESRSDVSPPSQIIRGVTTHSSHDPIHNTGFTIRSISNLGIFWFKKTAFCFWTVNINIKTKCFLFVWNVPMFKSAYADIAHFHDVPGHIFASQCIVAPLKHSLNI